MGRRLAIPALILLLRYHRRGQDVSALCVTACFGLLLAPVSWLPCWVWIAPIVVALLSWLQITWRGSAWRRDAGWRRWVGSGAVIGVIAVFASPCPIWVSPQRQRTLGPFWWFVLSNTYVLTALAIALVLGVGWLRRPAGQLDDSASGPAGGLWPG
jgi:alpha-1,2-mannosyltransferase